MLLSGLIKARVKLWSLMPLGAVLIASLLGACSPRTGMNGSGFDAGAHAPQTGSAGGAVVPNARPAM